MMVVVVIPIGKKNGFNEGIGSDKCSVCLNGPQTYVNTILRNRNTVLFKSHSALIKQASRATRPLLQAIYNLPSMSLKKCSKTTEKEAVIALKLRRNTSC